MNGGLVDSEPPALVAHDVDTYALSDPGRSTLVYTVNAAGDRDGVYVRQFGP
jgi:hypothetical protein